MYITTYEEKLFKARRATLNWHLNQLYTSIICHCLNILISVTYEKKFDSDSQSHSDDNIILKGLSVLKKTSLFCLSLVHFPSALSVSLNWKKYIFAIMFYSLDNQHTRIHFLKLKLGRNVEDFKFFLRYLPKQISSKIAHSCSFGMAD